MSNEKGAQIRKINDYANISRIKNILDPIT